MGNNLKFNFALLPKNAQPPIECNGTSEYLALLILGLAVTSIFQFISSTTLSTFDLEDRAYARQIANNRLALVQTLEPMIGTNQRDGQIDFGGKTFFWSETINQSSDRMNEIRILVGKNQQATLYELRSFIEKK